MLEEDMTKKVDAFEVFGLVRGLYRLLWAVYRSTSDFLRHLTEILIFNAFSFENRTFLKLFYLRANLFSFQSFYTSIKLKL